MCWVQISTDLPLINQTLCDCYVFSLRPAILVVKRQCQAEALDSNPSPAFFLDPFTPNLYRAQLWRNVTVLLERLWGLSGRKTESMARTWRLQGATRRVLHF